MRRRKGSEDLGLGQDYVTLQCHDDRLLLKTMEEPSGQTVTYNYYNDGLPKQTVDPTGTINFAYDAKGRLETVTEGAQVITRTYDSLDRVTGFTDSQGNTIGYAYESGDNLNKLIYPNGKGEVDYEYDNAGRLTKATDWNGRETEFFYDIGSRLAEMRLPNGTKREYFYDSAGRVERQTDTHSFTGIVLLDQQYRFDALGRIVEEVVSPEPATYTIEHTIMAYDDDDRISSWQSGAVSIDPIFDTDGNMTTGVLEGLEETFVYDSRNRLIQAGTTTYSYDAEDRRIIKTEDGIITTLVHDPHAPFSRMLQKTIDGVTTYYIYAAGQLLYEETDGQITAYHFDSRGSTLALSDEIGSVVNRITYGTYGEIVATTTAPTTSFLYNGAYGVQTDDNGLLHMRARYYSTNLRRFINADPIGFEGGMNWYAYASGNPINYADPNGLKDFGLTSNDPNFVRPEVESFGDFLDIMFTDFPAAVYQGVTGIPGQIANRGREIRKGGDVLSTYIGGSFEFAGGVGSVIKIPENFANTGVFAVRYSGLAGQNEKYRANLEAEAIALGMQNLDVVYDNFIKGKELEFLGGAFGSGSAFAPLKVLSRRGAGLSNFSGTILGPIQGAHNQFDSFTGFSSGFYNSSNGFSNFIFSNDSSSFSLGIK